MQNELIDEALGRILSCIRDRGWDDDVDVIYTTDHGTTQGDFGLMFKGPFHIDGLMRLPLIWRPAASAGIPAGLVINDPVGQVDLAPTFTRIAGLPVPTWIEGSELPVTTAPERDAVFCQWDADKAGLEIKLRSIYDRSGFVCTTYKKTNYYEGTEGELYHLGDDPLQWTNLWDDPAYAAVRSELVAKTSGMERPDRKPPLERRSRT